MSVRIRLSRFGRIHRPFYRIGAFDSRMRRDGAALEYLGYYDPLLTTGQVVKLNKERIQHWIDQGALPSETVASFLRKDDMKLADPTVKRAKNKARAEKRKKSRAAKKS